MYQTVTEFDFIDAFKQAGQENNFSYEALQELFEYYEELEEDTGQQIELDVVAICCDWSEYDTDELQEQFSYLFEDETGPLDVDYIKQIVADNYTTIDVPNTNRLLVQES